MKARAKPASPPPVILAKPARAETPWSYRTHISCDEFRSNAAYTNWRPRGSGDWLLIFTAGGAGRIVAENGIVRTVRNGDALLYKPGEYQDYSTDPAVGEWRLLWAHFPSRPHWLPWLRWPATEEGLKLIHLPEGQGRAEFQAAMRAMLAAARRSMPNAREFAMNRLEEALLWAHTSTAHKSWREMDPRVRVAVEHLAAHAADPFHLADLARRCGLSVSRLAHLFREHTGTTPQQLVERQRLERAAQLLRLTSLSVTEVAQEVGYADAFYFSNRFARHYRKRPTAFRSEPDAAPEPPGPTPGVESSAREPRPSSPPPPARRRRG